MPSGPNFTLPPSWLLAPATSSMSTLSRMPLPFDIFTQAHQTIAQGESPDAITVGDVDETILGKLRIEGETQKSCFADRGDFQRHPRFGP